MLSVRVEVLLSAIADILLDEKTIGHDIDMDNLWHILSALRGPDVDGFEVTSTSKRKLDGVDVKSATTAVIRYHLLKRNSAGSTDLFFHSNFVNCYALVAPDSEGRCLLRMELYDNGESNHFVFHVRRAFAVLGLAWNKVNE